MPGNCGAELIGDANRQSSSQSTLLTQSAPVTLSLYPPLLLGNTILTHLRGAHCLSSFECKWGIHISSHQNSPCTSLFILVILWTATTLLFFVFKLLMYYFNTRWNARFWRARKHSKYLKDVQWRDDLVSQCNSFAKEPHRAPSKVQWWMGHLPWYSLLYKSPIFVNNCLKDYFGNIYLSSPR